MECVGKATRQSQYGHYGITVDISMRCTLPERFLVVVVNVFVFLNVFPGVIALTTVEVE